MKINISILFLFLYCLSFESAAQDILAEQKRHTEELFIEGKYFDAVTEGKRLTFFDTASRYSYTANLLIARSYKAGGRFNDALKYFNLARKYARNDLAGYESRIEAVKCLIILRSSSALTILRSLENEPSAGHAQFGCPAYWRGWYYLFCGEPGNAAEEFAKNDEGKFLAAFCDSINNEKYSVNFGRSISYLIPGSGLFYAGEYYKGMMSLAWNALGIWLTADALNSNRALDGVLIANFAWFRFYFGGVRNADKEIRNRNNELTNSAIDYLTINYKGLKP